MRRRRSNRWKQQGGDQKRGFGSSKDLSQPLIGSACDEDETNSMVLIGITKVGAGASGSSSSSSSSSYGGSGASYGGAASVNVTSVHGAGSQLLAPAPPAPRFGAGTDVLAPQAAAAGATTFTTAELCLYTNKFTDILGAGAFGTVCGGTLPDGRRIAVKQMELVAAAKKQRKSGRANPYEGEAGFRLELEVLSRYVHPNLVALLGHCIEKQRWKKKATSCSIVLEFMPGGSLLDRLRSWAGSVALAAQERFDIAADVARALHYLHAEASPPLIHQDVKSDNILLAEVGGRLIAKVADFGTARMAPQLAMNTAARAVGGSGGATHHSTQTVVGTRPYMPAEYLQSGHVSEKTDTFAYGVVLLELLTGLPPCNESTGEVLHQHAYDLLCDPARQLGPALDARVPHASWAHAGARGELAGRALELCLVARHCLETQVRVRGNMREATPTVVALASASAAAGDARATQ